MKNSLPVSPTFSGSPMGVAIIGCGFVADYYVRNAQACPELRLKGCFDRSPERLQAFSRHFSLPAYRDLNELLADAEVELVLNLVNPHSHAQLTRACLQAGKHVYSEKPVALSLAEAEELVQTARHCGRRLGCAPCSVLSPTAQTVWRALHDGLIGQVRLACANYDDGRIAPDLRPWQWRSESGAPWPAQDEFQTGCTYEHAGYFLTWLAAFFGPVRKVTAFSACLIPDKGIPVPDMAPDYSVGCLEYDSGIVARVSCGLVGPKDKSLVIVGDRGYLQVGSLRNDVEPVYFQPFEASMKKSHWVAQWRAFRHRFRRGFVRGYSSPSATALRLPFAVSPSLQPAGADKFVDFCRGVRDMASAIREGRPHRLSAELALHVCELVEALQYPARFEREHRIGTGCGAMAPLEWAC